MPLEDERIKMAPTSPFNMSMQSVEAGYESTMCVTCSNRAGVVKNDGLVYHQRPRVADCGDTMYRSPASVVQETSFGYKLRANKTIPIVTYFQNTEPLCRVVSCSIKRVGCKEDAEASPNMFLTTIPGKGWHLQLRRDEQLGYKEHFCL